MTFLTLSFLASLGLSFPQQHYSVWDQTINLVRKEGGIKTEKRQVKNMYCKLQKLCLPTPRLAEGKTLAHCPNSVIDLNVQSTVVVVVTVVGAGFHPPLLSGGSLGHDLKVK